MSGAGVENINWDVGKMAGQGVWLIRGCGWAGGVAGMREYMENRLHVGVEYNPRRRMDPEGDIVREKKGVTQLRNPPLLRPPYR